MFSARLSHMMPDYAYERPFAARGAGLRPATPAEREP
jgi:hypothetical protein